MAKTQALAAEFSAPEIPVKQILGGLSPRRFFRDYWQKKPLLVRQALPGVERLISAAQLRGFASRDDAESRLVRQQRGRWQLDFGPFPQRSLNTLPKKDWALLVQGVNLLDRRADALLNQFNFVPYARLDDLMVSLAPAGGGVGPHFDHYDVFLIQGLGRRRWEISAQQDRTLVPDAPLRILANFTPDQVFELEPGDLLYLPPHYAHNGVALTECMTLSVGFRSPSHNEMTVQFLNHLIDTIDAPGHYTDPDLQASRHPGVIPPTMLKRLSQQVLTSLAGRGRDLEDSIARYLSEPKPSVFFTPPPRLPTLAQFINRAGQNGVALHPGTRLLRTKKCFYINGEQFAANPSERAALSPLADQRTLPGDAIPGRAMPRLYDWFCAGYLLYRDHSKKLR